ncbi:VOC family protein [Winogradskyella sp. PG-2]|uniref:VOC family protein n=1 Tax=Winogradskyella sp. PG-2 TaxID=754409 RepID=UPI00045863ED|nr:VOC family protein [Winogradskyella sp. PG-2]BAO77251.1 PhnB protein [Winogradskyella sp. PG-2]
MRKIVPILIITLLIFSCTNYKANNDANVELTALQTKIDSLKKSKKETKEQIATFLTFQDNNAEKAMDFYVELFDNSKIISIQRWEKGGPVEEGKIMTAKFNLNGSLFMCSDSPPINDWDFSPAVSNFIDCVNENELEQLFSKLSKNGNVTMPLNNYGFSYRFGWVVDQFGVSWQLNLK